VGTLSFQIIAPNLAIMGVPRATPDHIPDLITVRATPYPVLTRYKLLCQDFRVIPFAGGDYVNQGPNWNTGFVTSGYRIHGSENSPHRFALAIDIAVGDLAEQIKWGRQALRYFFRVGLYPQNGIIHVDLCDEHWQRRFGGRPSWVRIDGKYTSFATLEEAIAFAEAA